MHFKQAIKEYQTKGYGTEAKMWASIDVLDEAMMFLKEKNPDIYEETMRTIHEVFCGPHYNETFARMDVAAMHHKNKAGQTEKGEHWNINQVTAALKGFSLPPNATQWDAYVALNANWHDKEVEYTGWFEDNAEKHIIEDAVNFYFRDDDAPEGKVWKYMCAMDD